MTRTPTQLQRTDVWFGAGLGLLLAGIFWAPAFSELQRTGFGDWQFFHQMWEAGRVAIERHGEVPLWNPYQCGGVTIWGNPQAQTYSPFFLVSLLTGTTVAIKLYVLVHTALGIWGFYWLARREYGLGLPSACLGSVMWGCCAFFAWHGAGGHSPFLAFNYLPWILLAWRNAVRDPRWCAAVGGLCALMALHGATYALPYSALLVGFDALVQLTDRKQWKRTLTAGALSGVLAVLMCSFRIVPVLNTLSLYPRNLKGADSVDFSEVLMMFTTRKHPWRFPPHEYVWPEYAGYIGWVGLALALLGLVLCLRKGPRHIVVGALIFGTLMMGHRAPYFPWPLLKHLPVFESMRVPSRFVVLTNLYLGLAAGIGLAGLGALFQRFKRQRVPQVLTCAIVLGVLVDIFTVTLPVNDRWKGPPITRAEPESTFHMVAPRNFHHLYASLPQRNLGTPGCYEAFPFPKPRTLWVGPQPQARLEGVDGKVQEASRTPNSLRTRVQLAAAGRVVFNQTYAPGWKSNAGQIVDHHRHLAVDLAAGQHELQIHYEPDDIRLALGLTLAGLALGALTGAWPAIRRRRRLRS